MDPRRVYALASFMSRVSRENKQAASGKGQPLACQTTSSRVVLKADVKLCQVKPLEEFVTMYSSSQPFHQHPQYTPNQWQCFSSRFCYSWSTKRISDIWPREIRLANRSSMILYSVGFAVLPLHPMYPARRPFPVSTPHIHPVIHAMNDVDLGEAGVSPRRLSFER
ncbi:hypothetical protein BX600DRAFT_89494 [Xylariales sp. PMI_506]|nr:hypothetical protein BX600DRAFT_89494 [Xylariales sp. PMI_506]